MTSKPAVNLHKYGNQVLARHITIDAASTVFTKTASRILTKNAIAIEPLNYRAVQFSDKAYILSIPMSEDETAKIYEITDPEGYIDWNLSSGQRRLYPINRMKLIKEITQPAVNKKLYNMSFSGYKK